MLSACQWVYEGIHLGAVTNRMLDLTKGVADAVGGNDSVSHGCSSVAGQHTKSGRLASTIHTKQTKTLGKGEMEGERRKKKMMRHCASQGAEPGVRGHVTSHPLVHSSHLCLVHSETQLVDGYPGLPVTRPTAIHLAKVVQG